MTEFRSEVLMKQEVFRNPEEGSGGGYPHPLGCTCGEKHPEPYRAPELPTPETDEDPCPRCGGDHDRIDRREPCPTGEVDR